MLRVFAVSLLLAGCSLLQQTGLLVVGEGPISTETRQVGSFDRVEFNGGVRFELTVGQPASVTVTAQANLLAVTTSEVLAGKLTVTTTRPYQTPEGIMVTVTTPLLISIDVNGGVSGDVQAIAASDFAVDANGGASLALAGTCTSLTLSVNGGAFVDGTNLATTDATVDLNGGARANISASGSVTGSANAGASLNLLGNPASVNVTASGGASVHR